MFRTLRPRVILITTFIVLSIVVLLNYSLPKRPNNVLLISIDTIRPDHMGVYGYGKNTTPNIDKWAKKGTAFTNVTTVVPMTEPSFAALMTGKDPVTTRVIANQGISVVDNTKTLASILSDNGFKTGAYVSNVLVGSGFNTERTTRFKGYYYLDKDKPIPGTERFREFGSRQDYEEFILSSTDWIRENKNDRFFLWVHLIDPHEAYFPPEEYKCKFNPKYCPQIKGKSLDELDALRAEYQSCQDGPVPKDRVELMETLYDGEIATADNLVGRILDSVKKMGLDKDTLVVIYGDHGEGFDHNYYFNHREALYDSSIKIPLIIINPNQKQDAKSDLMLQSSDVLPTVLDLLGINRQEYKFDGNSFAGIFSWFGSKNVRKSSISINSTWSKYSITKGDYKYIYSLPRSCLNAGQTEELFNLKKDPGETKNLMSQDIGIANRLKNDLMEYLSNYNLPIEIPQTQIQQDKAENIKSLGY